MRITPRRFKLTLISLVLTTVVVVPTAFALRPVLQRWYFIRLAGSDDPGQREQGLNYALVHGDDSPAVVRGLIRLLDTSDDEHFLQLVNTLDRVGAWRVERVGVEPWLRWVGMILEESDPQARILGARKLLDLPLAADPERAARLLERLLSAGDAEVRLNALAVCAELAGGRPSSRGSGSSALIELIRNATRDTEPAVAFDAWLFLGHLAPPTTPSPVDPEDPTLGGMDTDPAGAMLWALSEADPPRTELAARLLTDARADPAWRAMAAYALQGAEPLEDFLRERLPALLERAASRLYGGERASGQASSREAGAGEMGAGEAGYAAAGGGADSSADADDGSDPPVAERGAVARDVADERAQADTAATDRAAAQDDAHALEAVLAWRAVLGARSPEVVAPLLEPTAIANADAATEPLVRAGAYRFPTRYDTADELRSLRVSPLTLLAVLEGWLERARPGAPDLPVRTVDAMPELLKVTLVAAAEPKNVEPIDLDGAFRSPQSHLRDLACFHALRRFSPAELEPLCRSLIRDYNDHAKMSGAVLAGLAGLALPVTDENFSKPPSAKPREPEYAETERPPGERDARADHHASTQQSGSAPDADPPRDLLTRSALAEDVWRVRQIMQLGRRLRGDKVETIDPALLLTREDLPRSTLIMGLLHLATRSASSERTADSRHHGPTPIRAARRSETPRRTRPDTSTAAAALTSGLVARFDVDAVAHAVYAANPAGAADPGSPSPDSAGPTESFGSTRSGDLSPIVAPPVSARPMIAPTAKGRPGVAAEAAAEAANKTEGENTRQAGAGSGRPGSGDHAVAALDALLTPHAGMDPRLPELLDTRRWWRVLRAALPESAPPLWHWADEPLIRFQLQVLRAWYVVHRRRMLGPEPAVRLRPFSPRAAPSMSTTSEKGP